MKPKAIITIALLIFVVISVAFIVLRELRPASTAPAAGPDGSPLRDAGAASTIEPSGLTFSGLDHAVIACYFHGGMRCKTCLAIEKNAEDALRAAYPDAFASGKVQWRTVNFDDPEHVHYKEEYDLYTSSLVLIDVHDGAERDWKLLERTWDLVWEEEAFDAYVENEMRPYLEHDA
jgi:hypothetical protein